MIMMSQNINKFWSGKLGFRSTLDYSHYWDFQLGEDEYILRRLKHHTDPIIWFDSDSGSTINCGDRGIEIDSLSRWSNATASAFTLNDIGLTGIDTQYVDQMSGVTMTFLGGESLVLKMVDGNLLFDNGVGQYPINYDIASMNDYSGQYYKGDGGFFQGFFKLHDYPFELMPTRMEKGWTMEFLLKVGCCDCHTCPSTYDLTLNDIYPENKDIFFLIGARAENKYWNCFSGETDVVTSSGIPLPPEATVPAPGKNSIPYWNELLVGQQRTIPDNLIGLEPNNSIIHWNELLIPNSQGSVASCNSCDATTCCNGSCNGKCYGRCINVTRTDISGSSCTCGALNDCHILVPDKDPNFDIINNVLAFRLDCETKQLGYRKVAFSGVCVSVATIVNTGTTECDVATGMTYATHMEARAVIEEKMSPNSIFADSCFSDAVRSGVCSAETWVQITVKFVRNFTLNDCELLNRGGNNDINYNDTSTYLKLLKYQDEVNWRKGKLIFYVNGKKHFVVDDFEEIIPRHLDTHKEKQQGVPFNISWGGGTQGLLESITFSGWTGGIEQDSRDYKLLMEKNFAGTWCGGYAVMKMYDKPLENYEIINNFCKFVNRFHLQKLICCQCTPNNPYDI
jgi:hypothetical protein